MTESNYSECAAILSLKIFKGIGHLVQTIQFLKLNYIQVNSK